MCPAEAFQSILDIDLAKLAGEGFRLILIDVDNTLLPWRSEEMPQSSIDWIAHGKELGLNFCIISNTRNPERLERLANKLGIDYKFGKFKPSRAMFLEAMSDFQTTPDHTVMIGDQLLTDILGANRSGVTGLWVNRIHKREFIGTRANRVLEKAIRKNLYRVIEEEEDDLPIVRPEGIFQRRIVRQLFKFCLVGGSSFMIDAGLHKLLMFYIPYGSDRFSHAFGVWLQTILHGTAPTPWQAHNASFQVFKVFTAGLAILNSFYWNRKWTFGIRGQEDRKEQLVKFLVVSFIGMALNVLIASFINRVAKGNEQQSWWLATIVATLVVAIWNFTGQRLYAFRRRAPQ